MWTDHVHGAPCHPQIPGKVERWHQTLRNRIFLENYFLPAAFYLAAAQRGNALIVDCRDQRVDGLEQFSDLLFPGALFKIGVDGRAFGRNLVDEVFRFCREPDHSTPSIQWVLAQHNKSVGIQRLYDA